MTWLLISLPLMVLAVGIAAVPLLFMVRHEHHRTEAARALLEARPIVVPVEEPVLQEALVA